MSAPAPASTTRRRRFADPRLFIGLLLVAASVAATVGIVASVDRRTEVYAAAGPLEPGQRIDASDLVARGVALDGSDALYLGVGDIPHGGLVITRPVAQGELVPASSVGRHADADDTSLVLRLATRVSGAVKAGARVDVWSAAPVTALAVTTDGADPDGDGIAPPSVIVSDATVVRVLDGDQTLTADHEGSVVEVRLPRSRVARVLAAIAAGDDLAIVPAGLGLSDAP
ncbi:hypothetical protein GCM10009840_14810 [Pseudolysinimonas kribbensis]|uniref:SAF domain-containing protein n=1 Tax=Pseudolysinimonas kribbensis TaxID=433641 RepID=A0ABQ6K0R2_9MICO|nr:hypothetical protein [Pseudolysinimonas kribbensis]GMA94185.1 hypothetical protein GCM10025881_10090 [Pseudolysinimonas kribbensis]